MGIEIGQKGKLFNLAEAKQHFALVQSITQNAQTELTPIQQRLNRMLSNDPRRVKIEVEYEAVVSAWKFKVEQLGAHVCALWVVEFDVGKARLCWRYPELSLNYVRVNGQAFSSRCKLADYIEQHDPDWV